jgi:hypothetical protein
MEAMTLCRGRYPLLRRSKLIPPQRPAILKCPYLTGRSLRESAYVPLLDSGDCAGLAATRQTGQCH